MFLSALLLALASSTDNFAVGVGVSGGQRKSIQKMNCIISVCNALGAFVAASVGSVLEHEWRLSFLASLAFFYLAYQEGKEDESTPSTVGDRGTDDKRHAISSSTTSALLMAIPMTLNNLVGGVAGGVVGITPNMAGICALMASYITMAVGHAVGRQFGSGTNKMGAGMFGILGVLSMWNVVTELYS